MQNDDHVRMLLYSKNVFDEQGKLSSLDRTFS